MGRIGKGIELLLWSVAALCLGIGVFTAVTAQGARRSALSIVPGMQAGGVDVHASEQSDPVVASSEEIPTGETSKHSTGDVIGRVEIPAIGVNVPMTDGIDGTSLLKGVGHIKGTAMPGGLGTLGLAGHRDTYLRALQRIAVGMDIRVLDQTGTYHYKVDSTEIVAPEEVSVLSIRSRPELALVTCYPFYFVGSAPRRFIVHAHLLSADPDATVTHASK